MALPPRSQDSYPNTPAKIIPIDPFCSAVRRTRTSTELNSAVSAKSIPTVWSVRSGR